MIVYVLCPDDAAVKTARDLYTEPEFKCICLPNEENPFLESFVFSDILLDRKEEWIHHDFVGTISHSACTKQPLVTRLPEIVDIATQKGCDAVTLMYRGDPLLRTAEKWHPGFCETWKVVCERLGFRESEYMRDDLLSFYCNYFLVAPRIMESYCRMLSALKVWMRLDTLLLHQFMKDSHYDDRGPEIAKISDDKKKKLFGVAHYPMGVFVCERLPCLILPQLSGKMLHIR